MKLRNLISILCMAVVFSACDDGVPEKLEFAQFKSLYLSAASSDVHRVTLLSQRDTTLVFGNIAYGGTTWFGEGNIVATIAPDFDLVDTYNTEHQTSYEPLPEYSYAFDKTKLVIENGYNYSSAAKLVLVPSELDPNKAYLLPVVMNKVSGGLTVNEDKNTAYWLIAFGGGAVPVKKKTYPLKFTSSLAGLTVTEGGDYTKLSTTNADPNIQTTKLGEVMISGANRVIAFEYKSNKKVTNAEFFYCVDGGPVGGKSSGENITIEKADDWTRFEFDLTDAITRFSFGTSADHFFRFDPAKEAGYEISIRNMQVEVYPID